MSDLPHQRRDEVADEAEIKGRKQKSSDSLTGGRRDTGLVSLFLA